MIVKFMWIFRRPTIAKPLLRKNEIRGIAIIIPDYYKAIVIKRVWHGFRNR